MIVLSSFKTGFDLFFAKKINLLWAILPFFFGIILYLGFGAFLFSQLQFIVTDVLDVRFVNEWISGITFVSLGLLVAIVVYFLFNWFFLLCVFFLSYPFHRMVSLNTEKQLLTETVVYPPFSFSSLKNEASKILLNLVLTVMIFVVALIPMLTPLAVIGSAILISLQFVDYVWSRHNYNLQECIHDLKKYFLNYVGMGFLSLLIFAIPVINVMMMPILVSSFTVMFYKQRGQA